MFLYGLILFLWCFSILINYYLFFRFLQFKGNFVCGQNNRKFRLSQSPFPLDWSPPTPLTSIHDETVLKQDVNWKWLLTRVWYDWCLPISVEENETTFTCNWLNGINMVSFFRITIIWNRQLIYRLKMILHHLLCERNAYNQPIIEMEWIEMQI